MLPDDRLPASTEVGQIVWPTTEERDRGRAEIERFSSVWKASPALLIIKPDLGVVVSLKDIAHDERYFTLTLEVEETIVAPDGFDPQAPIELRCVWNQPYLSVVSDCINAPYCFRLHFGAQGVRNVREFAATKLFRTLKDSSKDSSIIAGLLSGCFVPDFMPPE